MPVSRSSAATASGAALDAAAEEKVFRVIAYIVSPPRLKPGSFRGLPSKKRYRRSGPEIRF
jgi:hypothetical protein